MVASALNPPVVEGYSQSNEYYDPSHISPMGVIYRSVTQIGLGETQPESWMLERALTVDELLPMLTINGAYATFEDDLKGSLTPGKWADLVILSDNPLNVKGAEILDIKVLMTMVGGQVEFCANQEDIICLPTDGIAAPDFSHASGHWIATDNDGSSMTMDVIQITDSSYSILVMDDDATMCHKYVDSQESLGVQVEGTGTSSGYTLNLYNVTAVCNESDKSITLDMSFTYDPETDTIIDNTGVLWHRK